MQVLAPSYIPSSPPSNYHLGERIGNLSRDVASVLATVMDAHDIVFQFQCVLLDDSNHKAEGYAIKVIILSDNEPHNTNKIMQLLSSRGLEPLRID